MISLILSVIALGVVVFIFEFLRPIIIYNKIGSYTEYKPVSKSLGNKKFEYESYQVMGFKNIGSEAIKYLSKISRCCSKNDLKWLNECKEYLKKALAKVGENDFMLSDPIENASMLETLIKIRRCRKPLPENYQKMGVTTCGEAVTMLIIITDRIMSIESGEPCKPGDMDFFIDALKEIKG